MVKGWESRAELANKKREEARQRKQERKGPKIINGESALTALLQGKYVDISLHSLECWIASDDGGKPLCAAHFRADACRAKRCRHSHACSIALMRGVECKDLNSSAEAIMIEPLVIKVADIASLSRSDYAMIHFLFLDNLCIFDHANEKNWKTWTNGFKVERGDLLTEVDSKLSALPPITEVDEATDAGVVLVTAQSSELSDDAIKTSHHSSSKSSLTLQPDRVIFKILSFCSDLDICRVNETCTYLNIAISNDELLVYRKREYLSSIRLTGKDLSKMKKQEKKKKIKAANYNKLPKKDAYRV